MKKLVLIVVCLCVSATAVIIAALLFVPQKDNSETGSAITNGQSALDVFPVLFADHETIDAIKEDTADEDIPGWTETPGAVLDFANVIPVYFTANAAEDSSTIRETLVYENQYMIPALSDGECIGAFTVALSDNRWMVASYIVGLDIKSEIERNQEKGLSVNTDF